MNSKSQYKPKAKKPKNAASKVKAVKLQQDLQRLSQISKSIKSSSMSSDFRRDSSELVAAPAAVARLMTSNKPVIRADYDSKRVIHRELLGSVTGTVAFAIAQTIALNPGLNTSFPWLSMESLGWETYRFNRLQFEYVSRTGSNTPGSVILTTDYDASDPAPVSEQIAANYAGAAENAPWLEICQKLNPLALHSMGPRKFLRYGALGSNEDIKTYDSGNFYLCTLGGTAVPWGKLWVSYDVTFYTPQMVSSTLLSAAFQSESTTAPTTADPFAIGAATIKQGGPINVTVLGNVITFAVPGQYVVDYQATATTSVTNAGAAGAGGAVVQFFNVSGDASTNYTAHSIWTVSAPGGTVTLATTIVAGLTAHLLIAALPTSPIF